MTPPGSPPQCPDCGTPLHYSPPSCGNCGLPLLGTAAAELWSLEHRIAGLDRRRSALQTRHAALLNRLRAERDRQRSFHRGPAALPTAAALEAYGHTPVPAAAAPAAPAERSSGAAQSPVSPPSPMPPRRRPHRPGRPRRELSATSVRNILLALGGALLAIAAVVFTVVTWSDLGIGGKAAILTGLTALVSYLPHPLLGRGMAATAETLGALAVVLLCLDAFALWTVLDTEPVSGTGYSMVALSVIAVPLALYPRLVPLRGPRIAALLAVQPVPLLAVFSLQQPALLLIGLALLATALGDAAVAAAVRATHLRVIARTVGVLAWVFGLLLALFLVANPPGTVLAVAGMPGMFALAGAVVLFDSRSLAAPAGRQLATAAATAAWIAVLPAAVSALLALPAVREPSAQWLTAPSWFWPTWALASATAAVVLLRVAPERRAGPQITTGVSLALAGLDGLRALHLFERQLVWVAAPWQGGGDTGPAPETVLVAPVLSAVLAVAGGAFLVGGIGPATGGGPSSAHRTPGERTAVPSRTGTVRSGTLPPSAAIMLGAAVLAVALGAQWLPHAGTVAVLTSTAVTLLGTATLLSRSRTAQGTPGATAERARASWPGWTVLALALATGLLAAAGALAADVSTVLVLATMALGAATCAAVNRTADGVRSTTTVVAVVAATGIPVAAALILHAPPPVLALAPMTVAAGAVALATALDRSRARPVQVHELDAAAVVPLLLACGLAAAGGRDLLALTLALAALPALVAATHTAGLPSRPDGDRGPLPRPAGHSRFQSPAASAAPSTGALLPLAPAAYGSALLAVGALLPVVDRIAVTALSPWAGLGSGWDRRSAPAQLPLLVPAPELPLLLPALGAAAVAAVLCAALVPRRPAAAGRHRVLGTAGLVAGGIAVPISLAHLAAPYELALALLVVVTAPLLLLAGRSRGGTAHALGWTGLGVALMAAGWAATTPAHTVAVLSALSIIGILASAAATRASRRSAPAVSRTLAFSAATGTGITLLVGYAALPHAGIAVDQRWQAFVGLAAAAAVAGLAALGPRRPGAGGSGGPAPFGRQPADRSEQRTGLVAAGLLLVLVSAAVGAASSHSLGLVAAVAALVLVALANALNGQVQWIPCGLAVLAAASAALLVSPAWLTLLFAPFTWLGAVWQGVGGLQVPAADALSPTAPHSAVVPQVVPVAALVASGVLALVRLRARRYVPHAAVVLAPPVLVPFPTVLGLPYSVALGWLVLVAVVLLAVSALPADGTVATLAGGVALWPVLLALAWGLAERPATLATLLLIAVTAAAYPALGRNAVVTAGSTAVATLATGAFAVSLLHVMGQPTEVSSIGAIVVVAGVAMAIRLAPMAREVLLAAEGSIAVLAVVAIGLTLANTERLELTSVALAALGVIALAGAPVKGRGWLGGVGAVLLLLALWVLLGWLRVAAPEPYLAVPALAALVLGWEWRRRTLAGVRQAGAAPRDGLPHSWLVYGPGLALGLLPSLAMVHLVDGTPLRTALLGTAALAVTLVGGWYRLQAPLFVGAAVLLLLARQAFGGPLWEVVVAMPRWIPVGVLGLLLLVVGARYERNLRDLRRFGRMMRKMG
ncbi:SCO7613 C-terminal domain-containing membrane protein [Allosalinactinospora lopnorensis]|uniref:SCO7613 C-terminal domain-containing membrane protein n=1 Tax=Allosalinactinospora lopnorensis TaxID=1352348 RepID=UPI000623FB69|nr:hypothetical protein [Allosalinactinospora lopnorensis]